MSFADHATADLFHGRRSRKVRLLPPAVLPSAIRKLDQINAAHQIADLRAPPGNRLEALRGDWIGFHSIRVNDQWRIVFRWSEAQAHDVQIVDYHRG